MTGIAEFFPKNYLNPVYPHSFPDPFVLKFRGEYFAYCTGFAPDGKLFAILHSRDLVNWREIGGAMEKLPGDAPFYWAPEVTYHNGKFYLYYSVGNEVLMEIRVAVSGRPDGGFLDSGHRLTTEEFAIDAHVFEDARGERFFFYATDFLTHSHIGTGTVVDRMINFFQLEGNPRPVTRAKYDWQVYDPHRQEKGGVRWHTVEGPFILKRKGIYYEMFSGGNWQNPTYGVSFAVTDDIRRDEEWLQFSDGEKVLPILRTVPDLIIGPGHNSVVRGVNNREIYCVYHRWTGDGRVLAIDRMDFTGGGRMFVHGGTHMPQPAPFEPQVSDFFDEFCGENWVNLAGTWRVEENQIISHPGDGCEIVCRAEAESFLCEIWLRALEIRRDEGVFGIHLKNGEKDVFKFLFSHEKRQLTASWFEGDSETTEIFTLPEDFDFRAFHLLRIEKDYSALKVALDENTVRFQRMLEGGASQVAFTAQKVQAAFSGFALTAGFEDLFEGGNPEQKGWRKALGNGRFRIENQNLMISSEAETVLCKGAPQNNYEFAVNARVEQSPNENFAFGFYPAFDERAPTPFFSFERSDDRWILIVKNADQSKDLILSENFLPEVFHQFRFLKTGGKIMFLLETEVLDIIDAPPFPTKIALSVRNGAIACDMIRVTVL
jgi:GH43 family beta-xylosidase